MSRKPWLQNNLFPWDSKSFPWVTKSCFDANVQAISFHIKPNWPWGNSIKSCGNNFFTSGNDIISGRNELINGGNELASRGNDLASGGNNWASAGKDLVSGGKCLRSGSNEVFMGFYMLVLIHCFFPLHIWHWAGGRQKWTTSHRSLTIMVVMS